MLMLLPRMLLARPRGGRISQRKLQTRINMFTTGQWYLLLEVSNECVRAGVEASRRSGRDDIKSRVRRAETLVHLGELSAGCQALDGAEVAPGNLAELAQLTNPERRPPVPRDLLSGSRTAVPESFELDPELFCRNVRSGRRGAAPGASGMSVEHILRLVKSNHDVEIFCRVSPQSSAKPGLHTTTRELQTCAFDGPGASNTTRIPREDPQREEKNEFCGGRGKKSAKFWASPTLRPPTLPNLHPSNPTFRAFQPSNPTSSVFGSPLGHHPSPPFRPTPSELPLPLTHPTPTSNGPPTRTHTQKENLNNQFQKTQTINTPKSKDLHTTKTLTLAKVGLAKVGFDRLRGVSGV